MMRRRRYLQTTALALTGGLAGCSELGASGDESTPTDAQTPTESSPEPTETEEPTPRDEPREVEAPLYMDLLPRPQLRGPDDEGEYGSDNAEFAKVDWQWHLEMRETVPKFGPTSDEYWSFKPVRGNRERAPSADILKTPVYGHLNAAFVTEDQIESFPNVTSELRAQLGLAADDGEWEAAREVDEVLFFNAPFVSVLIGADTQAMREALADNEVAQDVSDMDTTIFRGALEEGSEEPSGRRIVVSEHRSRDIVVLQTDRYPPKQMAPIARRILGNTPPVTEEESVQWCLDQLVAAPVVTGEINGGRPEFGESPFGNRDLGPIEPFDTLVFGMDVSEYAGTVQAIVSAVDGGAPEPAALRDAFEEDTGTYSTTYHPNVSTISGSWP
jgi:hypothetical protein